MTIACLGSLGETGFRGGDAISIGRPYGLGLATQAGEPYGIGTVGECGNGQSRAMVNMQLAVEKFENCGIAGGIGHKIMNPESAHRNDLNPLK